MKFAEQGEAGFATREISSGVGNGTSSIMQMQERFSERC